MVHEQTVGRRSGALRRAREAQTFGSFEGGAFQTGEVEVRGKERGDHRRSQGVWEQASPQGWTRSVRRAEGLWTTLVTAGHSMIPGRDDPRGGRFQVLEEGRNRPGSV
ncbi:hypothetical protein B005_4030 [Nocardiopsis alba ATCC BAA-2165]|uniref:Uncharacterized protein n=1 Tax=Nocardiopsis alba (strain ATCC BAA-2165 / BE74) TaxID=1205910 RepID=J7LA95_NOCAA|nr:hypothetical protein B005_4030 [Nocardiopsis alba ATCC BAA-2165]